VEADISTVTGPYILADAAAEKYGKIDILVNNVSLAINAPLEEQGLEDWDRLVNLNGRGPFLLTKAVLKHLSKGLK
jgi:NAD(P)-dependent dehydrogenase (short-subunit alcohol dehydrogenase family)